MRILFIIFFTTTTLYASTQVTEGSPEIKKRLENIRAGLDTSFFVMRFQSIETPCVCINVNDDDSATQESIPNSNYRIRFFRDGVIDTNGVQCLSNYCSRYARFHVKCINVEDETISGEVSFTYGYPASSVIQYLGIALPSANRGNAFYEKLLNCSGTFSLYPEKDKYRLKVQLNTGPYDERDIFYAYLEISEGVYSDTKPASYQLYFDQMSLFKGDRNNQIFLRFSSTSFNEEAEYYAVLLYHTLRYINNPKNDRKKAEAIWAKNFYNNPECSACSFIYQMAEKMVKSNNFQMPNTNPVPSH